MLPRISGADPIGRPSSYRMHRASLFGLVSRQHVFLLVRFAHFRLDTISLANAAGHLGGLIDMQPHFLSVIPLDEIVTTF